MIHTRFSNIELTSWGIITRFQDGSESANWPPDDDAFRTLVKEVGFHSPLLYIQHHDLSHTYLSELLFNRPSPTLWSAAHGLEAENLYEERLVYLFQKEVRRVCVLVGDSVRAEKGERFWPHPPLAGGTPLPDGDLYLALNYKARSVLRSVAMIATGCDAIATQNDVNRADYTHVRIMRECVPPNSPASPCRNQPTDNPKSPCLTMNV